MALHEQEQEIKDGRAKAGFQEEVDRGAFMNRASEVGQLSPVKKTEGSSTLLKRLRSPMSSSKKKYKHSPIVDLDSSCSNYFSNQRESSKEKNEIANRRLQHDKEVHAAKTIADSEERQIRQAELAERTQERANNAALMARMFEFMSSKL